MTQATCTMCKQTKQATAFYKNPDKANGLRSECKDCRLAKISNTKRTPEQRERERARYQSRKKTKNARYSRPKDERYKARSMVSNAVASGKLERQPCEVCGTVKSQAHHDDYKKPLSVRWLCDLHHAEVHYPKRCLPRSQPEGEPASLTEKNVKQVFANLSDKMRGVPAFPTLLVAMENEEEGAQGCCKKCDKVLKGNFKNGQPIHYCCDHSCPCHTTN